MMRSLHANPCCLMGLVCVLGLAGAGCGGSSNAAQAAAVSSAIKAGQRQDAIELIRKHPGCVNVPDKLGVGLPADPSGMTKNWTMLHLAAYCGQQDVCEALLAAGAAVNAEVGGVTALDATLGVNPRHPRHEDILLFRSGYDGRIEAVTRLLRKHGARGRYFEVAVQALRDVEKTQEMNTLNQIIGGLGGGQD